MSIVSEWHEPRPYCLPGCNRLDGHDGRDAGACMQSGEMLKPAPLDLVHRHPDIPVNVPLRNAGPVHATGIVTYDLEPPSLARGMIPAVAPLRHPAARQQQQPRFLVPPVPDGHVRVELGDDYYAGAVWSPWTCITGDTAGNPAEIFDVPAEQVARWEKAQADYAAMQAEIEALRDTRHAGPPALPPGWVRKPPYQVQP